MLGKAIAKNALLLAVFSMITAGAIGFTYMMTHTQITENIRVVEEGALLEIIPAKHHNNSMLDDFVMFDDSELLKLKQPTKGYVAKKDGKVVAIIYPAIAPDGYSGAIRLIVGVFKDDTIAGIRVLEHHETPGLGDKIELKKSSWVLGFNGRSLTNPLPEQWKVKKDKGVFDQFTGATITPRAITASVLRVLQYHHAHKDELFTNVDKTEAHNE